MRIKISILVLFLSAFFFATLLLFVEFLIIKGDFAFRYTLFYFIIRFIFLFIGPIALLVIMNVKIMYVIRGIRKRRTDMGVNNRDSVTKTIVTVVAVFIASQLPLHMISLFLALFGSDVSDVRRVSKLNIFIVDQLFVILNSSVNFLIYCLVGEKFRQIFIHMISCK